MHTTHDWLFVHDAERGSALIVPCMCLRGVLGRYVLRRSDEDIRSLVDSLIEQSLDNWCVSAAVCPGRWAASWC